MVDYLLGCVNIVIVRKHKHTKGPNEMTYITEKFTAGEVELHVEATAIARSINLQKNLGIYKQAQAERTPAQVAEERMEARAAMGPGVDMVNIVTGEKFVS